MKIYISLPISGLGDNPRHQADLIKSALSKQGHTPVSPFDNYCGNNPAYEDFICQDLRVMLDCDAIYFCKGWEESCGCCIEHDVAQRFIKHERKQFKLIYE